MCLARSNTANDVCRAPQQECSLGFHHTNNRIKHSKRSRHACQYLVLRDSIAFPLKWAKKGQCRGLHPLCLQDRKQRGERNGHWKIFNGPLQRQIRELLALHVVDIVNMTTKVVNSAGSYLSSTLSTFSGETPDQGDSGGRVGHHCEDNRILVAYLSTWWPGSRSIGSLEETSN